MEQSEQSIALSLVTAVVSPLVLVYCGKAEVKVENGLLCDGAKLSVELKKRCSSCSCCLSFVCAPYYLCFLTLCPFCFEISSCHPLSSWQPISIQSMCSTISERMGWCSTGGGAIICQSEGQWFDFQLPLATCCFHQLSLDKTRTPHWLSMRPLVYESI